MISDFVTLVAIAAAQVLTAPVLAAQVLVVAVLMAPVLAAEVVLCPDTEPGQAGAGAGGAMCKVASWSDVVTGLPSWLWHQVTVNWGWLLGWCLFGAALAASWLVWRRWLLRRAVGRGSWLEVVPPGQTAVTASTAVWRLLSSLAARASGGLHVVHPPLAVEFHGDGRGRLLLAMWVPAWVPQREVAAEAGRAWPGAQVRPFVPLAERAGTKAAGFRLAAQNTDHELLVDEDYLRSRLAAGASPHGDPLWPVFNALQDADGPAVLQVLAKPAGGRRLSLLAQAAQRPGKPRQALGFKALGLVSAVVAGAVRLVLDVVTKGRPSSRHYGGTRVQAPDPLQRLAMRRAAEKLGAGPHLLVAIRAVAPGAAKARATRDAAAIAGGFRVAAGRLRLKRLWWARSAVSDRYARGGQWLLATCSELGVLFHLPADPARFGFTVAAATRPYPHQATRMRPEQADGTEPGWSGGEWTMPPGTATTAVSMHGNNNEGDDSPPAGYGELTDDDLDYLDFLDEEWED